MNPIKEHFGSFLAIFFLGALAGGAGVFGVLLLLGIVRLVS